MIGERGEVAFGAFGRVVPPGSTRARLTVAWTSAAHPHTGWCAGSVADDADRCRLAELSANTSGGHAPSGRTAACRRRVNPVPVSVDENGPASLLAGSDQCGGLQPPETPGRFSLLLPRLVEWWLRASTEDSKNAISATHNLEAVITGSALMR